MRALPRALSLYPCGVFHLAILFSRCQYTPLVEEVFRQSAAGRPLELAEDQLELGLDTLVLLEQTLAKRMKLWQSSVVTRVPQGLVSHPNCPLQVVALGEVTWVPPVVEVARGRLRMTKTAAQQTVSVATQPHSQ